MATKYIFVGGGVASSLGKGTASASIGALLESCGYQVALTKIDPYLNIDAGTMNPFQHGEVYVTDDGAETDLDLGNYERFTQHKTSKEHIITTGSIYQRVLTKEREGAYLGSCVQVIPHITQEVKDAIYRGINRDTDVVIIEIGGTAGDIESTLFFEVARQMILEKGRDNVAFVHVTLVPRISGANELKTKPTQHAVQKIREMGIQPNILLCRCDTALTAEMKSKISLFTHVASSAIISASDLKESVYELPISYHKEGLTAALVRSLQLTPPHPPQLAKWEALLQRIRHPIGNIEIALVGKYTQLKDADASLYEALAHGGFAHQWSVTIVPIDSEAIIDRAHAKQQLSKFDAIVVPGGFGKRGIEGKIHAVHYARTNNIPYLGICLGAQVMVIEYVRNVLGHQSAHSTEFDPHTPYPVVTLLEGQKKIKTKGGTMRLGAYEAQLLPDSLLANIYGIQHIVKRHRHRYEIAADYQQNYEAKGLSVGSISNQHGERVIEGVSWKEHYFGVGVQYHPELHSSPFVPEPLFPALIAAAIAQKKQ